ncbi:hypothetical protein BD770DRAFT_416305 [Pilaira anomala]|nr:hypothetical protein BD770DRAFT_416305 [Pilaira anomala]
MSFIRDNPTDTLLIIRLHKTTNQNLYVYVKYGVLLFDCDANVAVFLPWNIYNVLTCRNQHFSKCNALVLYLQISPGPRSLLLGVLPVIVMAGGVAMTGAAMTGVAMIGIALINTGVALVVVVMMDKTVVVMMQFLTVSAMQCNGFVKAMIKFCEFYFLASMLYLDGSCLLLFRPRLRAVRAVQSWVESWIDGSHLGRCHLKGKYYDQRLIVATTPQQLVILFFGEYVLSCPAFIEIQTFRSFYVISSVTASSDRTGNPGYLTMSK